MKNQSNVNDIFQNESSKNNKTKTILLLTIVAMILIITFLIVAWVVSRYNTIEPIQLTEDSKSIKVLNQPPYDYNVDNNKENNKSETSMLDPFGIDASKMSNSPPATIPTNISMLNVPNPSQKTNDMDNDPKMQAKLKELQQKHLEKNKNTQADKDSTKSITVTQKTPATKELSLTENKTNTTQETKQEATRTASSKNAQNTIKPNTKNTQTKGQNQSPNEKTSDDKKLAEAKLAQRQPSQSLANNPDKPKSDNIIDKKTQQIENNGKPATKGHYIQVGSFTGNVDKNFLNRISKYPYRIKTDDRDNKTVVKYLIGPYSSKVEANSNIQKIKEIQGNAFYVEIK